MHTVVGDVPEPHVASQVRKGAHHQMAVFDDVRNPRRRPRVVFEHAEHSLSVAHEVDAADADIGAVRKVEPLHLGAEVAVSDDELRGHRAIVQDVLLVVDVVQKAIERRDALNAATLDVRPIVPREDPRDGVGVCGGLSAAAEHIAKEAGAIVVGKKPFGTVGQRPSVRER